MLKYVKTVLARYVTPVLVETGTYTGEGVETALEMGFQRVISIELLDDFFVPAQKRFAGDPRVTLIKGDSASCLHNAIKDVESRMTFWLDGHSFPEREHDQSGIKTCPLLEELAAIKKHPIKTHVIMIDDMSTLPKGGAYKNVDFTRKDIEQAIESINPWYQISYFDRGGTDVLLAHADGCAA